jgi:MFS family permease
MTPETDNIYAWSRLAISLALATIGGIGAWASVVALPAIQVEYGIDRAGASLPYTATMIGFAFGGIIMGRFADRRGIAAPLLIGAFALGAGFIFAALARSYTQFLIVQFLLIGLLGSSVTLGPLVADVSQWFLRKRGIAVAIVSSGNYLAGTIWPPFFQQAISAYGWRATFMVIGALCIGTISQSAMSMAAMA